MSVATELSRIITAKADIKTAIEAKGVSVPSDALIDVYDDYIADIPASSSEWTPPADWIDISDVADNEINLLVCDGDLAFAVTVASSGTYSIDWGDGTVETSRASATTYEHRYVYGAGTAHVENGVTVYTTFKVRIYGATNTITRFQLKKHSLVTSTASNILWANFGTTGLTTCANLFYSSSTISPFLLNCLEFPELQNCASFNSALRFAYSLRKIVFRGSVANVSDWSYAFAYYGAPVYIMPEIIAASTTVDYLLAQANGLISLIIGSWGGIISMQYIADSCYTIRTVVLPSTISSGSFNCKGAFRTDQSLMRIINLEYLGSSDTDVDMTDMLKDCTSFDNGGNAAVINSRIKAIGIYCSTAAGNIPIAEIRLTNTDSTLSGSAPQINVSYTALTVSAINTLFGDMAAMNCTGKTIKIKGCTKLVRVAPTTTTYTTDSTTVTVNSNTGLAVGMFCNTMSKSVTFTDAGDLVNLTAHGLQNGDAVSLSAITSTTGITINTIYYVVNKTDNTFQLATTAGGSAVALTTDGTGTLRYCAYITNIDGTNITISRPSSLNGAVATVFLNVDPALVYHRNHTVTTA